MSEIEPTQILNNKLFDANKNGPYDDSVFSIDPKKIHEVDFDTPQHSKSKDSADVKSEMNKAVGKQQKLGMLIKEGSKHGSVSINHSDFKMQAIVSISQSPLKRPPVLYPKPKIDNIYQRANQEFMKDSRSIKRHYYSNSVINIEKLNKDAFSLYIPQYSKAPSPLRGVTEKHKHLKMKKNQSLAKNSRNTQNSSDVLITKRSGVPKSIESEVQRIQKEVSNLGEMSIININLNKEEPKLLIKPTSSLMQPILRNKIPKLLETPIETESEQI